MSARILVVDDQPLNVKLLEAKLTAEYYDVVTAADGVEALEKAADVRPDIILLDVMMPGMNGYEVCKRLKNDPELDHTPVVMVTALDASRDRIRGIAARLGGEKFIVVMSDTDMDTAQAITARLCRDVEAECVRERDGGSGQPFP